MLTGQKEQKTGSSIQETLRSAREALLHHQNKDGHWCYELEADATIPAEYIFLMHFMDEIDVALEAKLARYLRRIQNAEGGWPLYYNGETDISASVKAYYALKIAGDNPDDAHMARARKLILKMGGAAKSNVFTRIALAQFKQVPWRAVPFIPVEIVLFPRWFPFTMQKVSYWSRTVMVPLFILVSLKATAKNPRNVNIPELFTTPPEEERNYFPVWSNLNRLILTLERIGFRLEPFIPKFIRRKAIQKAEQWFTERLNGEAGLGAIFPAMVNAYEAMAELGYPKNHPLRATAKKALENLLVIRENEAYCQPCVSPVWDTLLASGALQADASAGETAQKAMRQGMHWLQERQLIGTYGDWQDYTGPIDGGGWPFQYKNDHYPDLDDTAFAAYIMHKIDPEKYRHNILAAARWLVAIQSKNGGFAAFDADNTHYYLNEIPFADHGALLDPPTADVSGRVVMLLGCLVNEYPEFEKPLERCLEYLTNEQESDGSWFGRWGTNYIYGTWSVLLALKEAGIPATDARVQKAVQWLKNHQNEDGGWGEDNYSYHDESYRGTGKSTAFQTAWAMMGLIAGGEQPDSVLGRGAFYLQRTQQEDGIWHDPEYTAPGFPRVFYLKYHGYTAFFPYWAMAQYHELEQRRNT